MRETRPAFLVGRESAEGTILGRDEVNYWQRFTRGRHSRRHMLRAGGALGMGAAGMLVVGCGDDDDDTPGSQTAPAGTTTGGNTPPAGSPKSGGTLSQPTTPFVAVLDPHTATQPNVLQIWQNVSHHLVELDEDLNITDQGVAASWEQPDDTTIIFKLHEGVHFHDVAPANGREFTAEDVVFSLNRIKDEATASPRRSQFSSIVQLEAQDKYTVKLVLDKPYAPILLYLGGMYNLMVCPEAVEQFGNLDQPEAAIGVGPFMLKEYNKESHASLVRNPNYFREGRPYLDGIEITPFADDAARHAAWRAGQLHMMNEFAQFMEDLGDLTGYQQTPILDSGLVFELGLNQKTFEPFRDPRVRRAIHLVLDREALLAAKWGAREYGLLAAPAPPALAPYGFTEEELSKMPGWRYPKDEDIAQAKQLMADAGFADGFKVGGKTANQYLADIEPALPWLKQHLNIEVDLEVKEWGAYKQDEREGNTEVFGTGYLVEPEIDSVLRAFHYSTGGRNYVGYSDPEADRLIDKQAGEYNIEARAELTREAGQYLIDNVAHTWHNGPYIAYRISKPGVNGVMSTKGSIYDRLDLTNAWLDA